VKELAFLNKGLTLRLKDERTEDGETYEYHYDGGLKSYVEELNKSKEVLTEEVIYLDSSREDVEVEIAMQYQDRKSTRLNSSHVSISYAVFCLKKKRTNNN